MKRLLLLLLATVFVLSAFAGCNKEPQTENTATTENTAVETLPDQPYELPLTDFEGEQAVILAMQGKIWQFEDYSSNADVVNEAIKKRTALINEKLNCELTMSYVDHSNEAYATAVNQEAMTQSGSYDLIYSARGAKPTTYGYYCNLLDMPEVALDQPFFGQGYNEALTINNTLYGATGYGSLSYIEGTSVIVFNKDLYEDLFEGSMYAYVDDMSWTLETMLQMSELAQLDRKGDGMDAEDRYGIAVTITGGSALMFSMGAQFMPFNDEGVPYFDYLNQKNIDIFGKVLNMMKQEYVTYTRDYLMNRDCFVEENCLFAMHYMSVPKVIRLTGTPIKYGMLPYPMLDASQGKYISSNEGAEDFSIMQSAKDTKKAAILLNAYNYYSYLHTRPAQFEGAMKGQLANSPDDARMLDIIMENVYLDFGYLYNSELGGYCSYAFTMCREFKDEYVSFYTGQKDTIEGRLAELLESYANPDED